jgi:hypothetical protein
LRLYRTFLRGLLLTTPLAAIATAQQPASFSTLTTPLTQPASNSYSIDLNNDGLSDIASINNLNTSGASVLIDLSKGDGTFAPTTSYTLPNTIASLAFGDFLGNGKVDILSSVLQPGGSDLYVLLGNGDGTFGTPVYLTSTPADIPNADAIRPLLVADFNSDGVLDLVTSVSSPDFQDIFLIESNGTGGYNAPRLIFSGSAPSGLVGYIGPGALGDFNGDAHADIAFTYVTENSNGGDMNSTVYVLYGDGDGNFNPVPVYNQVGQMYIQAGDLNSDGKTDIFGSPSDADRTVLLYGNGSESVTPYTLQGNTLGGSFTLADFNGDGFMDLAYINVDQDPTTANVGFFLGTSNPGIFSTEAYASIPQDIYASSGVLSGTFTRSNKPDLGLYQFNPGAPPTYTGYADETLSALLNTNEIGDWGACAYPSTGTGISVCAPVTSGAQTTFNAAANSYGMLRKIELWVDGVKIGEQYHTSGQRAWFGLTANVAPGSHQATYYAADIDNRLQRSDFEFTVAAPTKAATVRH